MLVVYLSMLGSDEDKNLFEQLYLEYKQIMYKIAYNVLNNPYDAEDAVHQSFLKIANKFTQISQIPHQKIKSYIVIVCEHTALDIYRKNKRTSESIAGFNINEIVDEAFFEPVEYTDLYAAIKMLPDIYKDVIYLYDIMELSAKDTADILNISTDAVYQRAARAKGLLKELLEKGEVFDAE